MEKTTGKMLDGFAFVVMKSSNTGAQGGSIGTYKKLSPMLLEIKSDVGAAAIKQKISYFGFTKSVFSFNWNHLWRRSVCGRYSCGLWCCNY